MPIKFASNGFMTRCRWVLISVMVWLAAGAAWAQPPRTITLAPHLTELVYAVGGEAALVGVVAWSDYPAAAQHLPHIGDAFRLDLERIVALQAEQALAWTGGTPPEAARRLEQLGLTVHWIETQSLDQIASAMRHIGLALNMADTAEDAATEFTSALQHRRQQRPETTDLRVFYQVSAQPLFTLGGQHVINEVFELCGARNVFADLNTEASAVDREAVLARSPDVIVIGHNGDSHEASTIQSDPLLVDRAPVIVINADFLVRPTPRLVKGIDQLCSQLEGLRDATD
jgi:iron complex transport system substrate-binding protein